MQMRVIVAVIANGTSPHTTDSLSEIISFQASRQGVTLSIRHFQATVLFSQRSTSATTACRDIWHAEPKPAIACAVP